MPKTKLAVIRGGLLIIASLFLVSCNSSSSVNEISNTDENTISNNITSENVVTLYVPTFSSKAIVLSNINTNVNASAESVSNIPNSKISLLSSITQPITTEKSRMMKDVYPITRHSPLSSRALSRISPSQQFSISSDDTSHTFYSTNLNNNQLKTVDANLVYGNNDTTCLIYLEDGLDDSFDWNTIGSLFDETIYPKVADKFGTPLDVDNNDQIVILYSSFENNNIVGYFYSGDLFEEDGSNQMELLYMNVLTTNYPTLNYQTLAHEFQHLTNTSEAIRNNNGNYMETWLNEGLAEAASHYALGYPIEEHIEAIQTSNDIANGLSVINWLGSFYNYTLSYLFSEYLKNNASGGVDIFLDMILTDSDAVTQVETAMAGQNDSISTMEEFLTYFRLANIVQGDDIYGYGDESDIFNFDTIPAPNTYNSTIELKSGGSIVIYPSDADFDSFDPSSIGDNIIIYKVYGNE